jgi:hypothetical protein
MDKKPDSPQKNLILWFLIVTTIGLASYFLISTAYFADIKASQKRDNLIIGSLDGGHYYVQSFVPNSQYLTMVEVPLLFTEGAKKGVGKISLHLQDCKQNTILSAEYELPVVGQESNIRFRFPPLNTSLRHQYCLLIQSDAPTGSVFVLGSEYDIYPEGDLYINGVQTDQDIAFFTYNKPTPLMLVQQTFQSSFRRFGLLGVMTILIIIWGFGVSPLISSRENIIERIVYTLIIGVSLPSILLFLLSATGIKLEKQVLLIAILCLSILSLISGIAFLRKLSIQSLDRSQSIEFVVLAALFTIALFTRTAQVKDLIVPSGIGIQTHERILEKIDRTQAIPLGSIYHTGFHSNVIFLHILMDQTLPETTLLYGQWLSVIAGLPFYILARKIFSSPFAAIFAIVLYWFISPIPAFFINISRYPLLQAMTFIPAVIVLFWDHLTGRSISRIPVIILMTGILLTHIGSFLIILVVGLGIYIHILSISDPLLRTQISTIKAVALVFIPVVMVAVIRFYFVVSQGTWESFLNRPAIRVTPDDYQYIFSHTLQQGGPVLWLLGIAGGIVLFTRKPKYILSVGIVIMMLLILDRLQIAIIGRSASNLTDILFSLAIPLSLLGGYFLGEVQHRNKIAGLLIVVSFTFLGGYNTSAIVDPRNVFCSQADQDAFDWIDENTPRESIFLINSYPWDGQYKPTDCGYWILAFTGREVVFPGSSIKNEELQQFIVQNGVDYVYLGSGYGGLTPIDMSNLSLVYVQKGIYIYKRKTTNRISFDNSTTFTNLPFATQDN